MLNWFKRLFSVKSSPSPSGSLDAALAEVPEGWFVFRLHQTPMFLLWDCVLIEMRHDAVQGRVIECSENDTAVEAVRCCLSRLNGGKRICKYDCGHGE